MSSSETVKTPTQSITNTSPATNRSVTQTEANNSKSTVTVTQSPPSSPQINVNNNTSQSTNQQTDNLDNSYPFKNEVSLSIGDEHQTSEQIPVITPTPSPRGTSSATDRSGGPIQIDISNDEIDNIQLRRSMKSSPSSTSTTALNDINGSSHKMGIDNPSFEPEQTKPRPLSSFGQNGGLNDPSSSANNNGKSHDSNKSPVTAVNLELINLNKPTNGNGIPVKKDTEVDVGNPYDEYFVPVNEHRKYMSVSFGRTHGRYGSHGVDKFGHSLNDTAQGIMDYKKWTKVTRGEKLYVTQDRRILSKKDWRKWMCWMICAAFVVGVIIIAILAGTGVILGNEPTPIESRKFGSSEKQVKTASTFGAGSSISNDDNMTNTTYPTSPKPPGTTISPIPPTTEDITVYVSNTLAAQLTLSNLEFLDEYNNKESVVYQRLAQELEDTMKEILKADGSNNEVYVRVMDMKPGSVIVEYRVSWKKDIGDIYVEESLNEKLKSYLERNHGYLSSFKVPVNTLRAARLPDVCSMNKSDLKCDMGCEFNEKFSDFVCRCPDNMEIDIWTKECQEKKTVGTFNVYEVTRPPKSLNHDDQNETGDYDSNMHKGHSDPDYHGHNGDHHDEIHHYYPEQSDSWSEPESVPEPTSEPEPEPEPEPTSEPEPEPQVFNGSSVSTVGSSRSFDNNDDDHYNYNHHHHLDQSHEHENNHHMPELHSSTDHDSNGTDISNESTSTSHSDLNNIHTLHTTGSVESESEFEAKSEPEPEPEPKSETEEPEPEPKSEPEPEPEPKSKTEHETDSTTKSKFASDKTDEPMHNIYVIHGSDEKINGTSTMMTSTAKEGKDETIDPITKTVGTTVSSSSGAESITKETSEERSNSVGIFATSSDEFENKTQTMPENSSQTHNEENHILTSQNDSENDIQENYNGIDKTTTTVRTLEIGNATKSESIGDDRYIILPSRPEQTIETHQTTQTDSNENLTVIGINKSPATEHIQNSTSEDTATKSTMHTENHSNVVFPEYTENATSILNVLNTTESSKPVENENEERTIFVIPQGIQIKNETVEEQKNYQYTTLQETHPNNRTTQVEDQGEYIHTTAQEAFPRSRTTQVEDQEEYIHTTAQDAYPRNRTTQAEDQEEYIHSTIQDPNMSSRTTKIEDQESHIHTTAEDAYLRNRTTQIEDEEEYIHSTIQDPNMSSVITKTIDQERHPYTTLQDDYPRNRTMQTEDQEEHIHSTIQDPDIDSRTTKIEDQEWHTHTTEQNVYPINRTTQTEDLEEHIHSTIQDPDIDSRTTKIEDQERHTHTTAQDAYPKNRTTQIADEEEYIHSTIEDVFPRNRITQVGDQGEYIQKTTQDAYPRNQTTQFEDQEEYIHSTIQDLNMSSRTPQEEDQKKLIHTTSHAVYPMNRTTQVEDHEEYTHSTIEDSFPRNQITQMEDQGEYIHTTAQDNNLRNLTTQTKDQEEYTHSTIEDAYPRSLTDQLENTEKSTHTTAQDTDSRNGTMQTEVQEVYNTTAVVFNLGNIHNDSAAIYKTTEIQNENETKFDSAFPNTISTHDSQTETVMFQRIDATTNPDFPKLNDTESSENQSTLTSMEMEPNTTKIYEKKDNETVTVNSVNQISTVSETISVAGGETTQDVSHTLIPNNETQSTVMINETGNLMSTIDDNLMNSTEKHQSNATLEGPNTTNPISTIQKINSSPAPVIEDISDDIPNPTEVYFKTPRVMNNLDNVNLTDGFVPLIKLQNSSSVYSTAPPVELWKSSTETPSMNLSIIKPVYFVTEPVTESENLQNQHSISDQSPFLPEQENNITLLDILHRGHDFEIHNETEDNNTSVSKDENDEENEKHLDDDQKNSMNPIDDKKLINFTETHTEHTDIPLKVVPLNKKENEIVDDDLLLSKEIDKEHLFEADKVKKTITMIDEMDKTTVSYRDVNEEETTNEVLETSESTAKLNIVPETTATQEAVEQSISHVENIITSTENVNNTETIPNLMSTYTMNTMNSDNSSMISSTDILNNERTIFSNGNNPNEVILSEGKDVTNQIPYIDQYPEISLKDLKVIPLQKYPKKTVNKIETSDSPTSEVTETTTGHFLGEKTFQSNSEQNMELIGTSKVSEINSPPKLSTLTENNYLYYDESGNEILKNDKKNRIGKVYQNENDTKIEIPKIKNSTFDNSSGNKTKFLAESSEFVVPTHKDRPANDQQALETAHDEYQNSTNNVLENSLEENAKKLKEGLKDLAIDPSDFFKKCSAGQFECANGTSLMDGSVCINLSERCDSVIQCSDGSDEENCEELGCPGHFQCNDGLCLARHLVCDGVKHCFDGSDENHCDSWQCRFDEISCSTGGSPGRCLPATWKCDGLEQCPNGSDEVNCADNCGNSEFYCSTQHRCIPEIWKCDGHVDCLNEEDERLCDCDENEFKCTAGGCINMSQVCDGVHNCYDMSDELGCFELNKMSDNVSSNEYLLMIKHSGKSRKICADDWNKLRSDEICQKIGFNGVKSWTVLALNNTNSNSSVNDDGGEEYLRLKSIMKNGELLQNFDSSSTCDDGLISLMCSSYECNTNTFSKSSLALAVDSKSGIECMTTIIAPKWALASYTCLIKSPDINGPNIKDLQNWYLAINDEIPTLDLSAERKIIKAQIYTHSRYHHLMYSEDFVLLELEKPLDFNSNLKPTCLTTGKLLNSKQMCSVSSLDMNYEDNNFVFKSKNVTILSSNECNSTELFGGTLPSNSICSILEQKDYNNTTCETNEGAPLSCYGSDGKWSVQGFVSYHGGCGRRPQATVYSLITDDIRQWITNRIGNSLMF